MFGGREAGEALILVWKWLLIVVALRVVSLDSVCTWCGLICKCMLRGDGMVWDLIRAWLRGRWGPSCACWRSLQDTGYRSNIRVALCG